MHIQTPAQNQIELVKLEYTKHISLYGLYLHGSIAMDCMGPNSDIDILGVTNESRLSRRVLIELAKTSLHISNQPYPLEISLIAKKDLCPFTHPTPYLFHYSEAWRAEYESGLKHDTLFAEVEIFNDTSDQGLFELPTDRDLAAHITITRKYGIALLGPSPDKCFEPVPHECYMDALIYDFEGLMSEAEKNPVYVVLNACRILAYHNDGLITSKKTGGLYGIDHLPAEWHYLIKRALSQYEIGRNECNYINSQDAKSFIAFATASMSL